MHRLCDFRPGRPALFAHRGASVAAPENTLRAFEAARKSGIDGVEFDVRRCASGEIVVIHDTDLTRLCGASGCVEQTGYSRLKGLRVLGSDQSIPRLEDVIDALGADMLLDIELKLEQHRDPQLVQNVARVLSDRQIIDRVVITSFQPLPLRAIRRICPQIMTGLLYGDESPWYMHRAMAARLIGASCVAVQHERIDRRLVETRHRRNLRVFAWTVNTIARRRELIGMGVDALIGDDPAILGGATSTRPDG